jgi:RNA polymerase sigma factor (sigma-70 family)
MRDESEATLDALMGRLAAGERTAFEPLFRALYPRAVRFARARLGPDVADDVAQAALLNVFAHASRFVPGRPALPWFYAIVANELRAARRGVNRRGAASADLMNDLAEQPSHEDELLERELKRALQAAIDTLDDAAASAIHAQLGQGERPALEAATFRKRVSRAYARLRILLGEFR